MEKIMKNVFPYFFIALLVAGCGGGGGSSPVDGGTSPQTGSISGKIAPESGAELSRVASGAERTATASTVNAKVYAHPSSTSLNGLIPNTNVPYSVTNTAGNYTITGVPVGLVNLVIDYDSDGIADERQFDIIVSKNITTNTGTIEVAALNKDPHGSWCDVSLNKVNYSPGETIYMYVKGYNYGTTALKCGMKIILQKGQGETRMWISDFSDPSTYVAMVTESESSGTIQKVIPSTWSPTDTQPGSDYRVYTIRENGDKWGKGDNFNIHCTAACGSDSVCDDGNANTTDICVNPETCGSLCSNVECDVTCASDSGCDDGNDLTTDTCSDAGTCSASCSHTQCSVTCSANIECNDGNSLTTDVCVNAGTCEATCLNNLCTVICGNDADCDDDNPSTDDVCKNPGMCFSTCSNATCTPTCVNDSDCNDGNTLTTDTCNSPNTCSASCSHTACTPVCTSNSQCDDGNALTTDTCNSPNTCSASCSHTACTPVCTSNSQCDDDNALTTDTCKNPNTCNASCLHNASSNIFVWRNLAQIGQAEGEIFAYNLSGNVTQHVKNTAAVPIENNGVIDIADIDNDTDDELVLWVSRPGSVESYVSIYSNDDVPRGIKLQYPAYSPATYPSDMILADINSDGNIEIIFFMQGDTYGGIKIYDTSGNYIKGFSSTYSKGNNYLPASIAIGDINGDGDKEIILWTVDYNNRKGVLTYYDYSGNIVAPNEYTVYVAPKATGVVSSFDIDMDGKEEVVFWYSDADGGDLSVGGKIKIYHRDDGGTTEIGTRRSALHCPGDMIAKDVDGDGVKEILVWTQPESGAYAIGNGTLEIFKTNGIRLTGVTTPLTQPGNPVSITVGNLIFYKP